MPKMAPWKKAARKSKYWAPFHVETVLAQAGVEDGTWKLFGPRIQDDLLDAGVMSVVLSQCVETIERESIVELKQLALRASGLEPDED